MKIYVVGASGFMGSGCVSYLRTKGHEVLTEKVNITRYSDLIEKFSIAKPDVVINFAGVRTVPNIDWCERNKEETIAVNVNGAIHVALAAMAVGAHPIQISSGCIYSGDKEYTEDDEPDFFGSFYSRMRIIMQNALKEFPVLQLRVRMPMCRFEHPRNFITKIVAYKKVISVPNSITLLEDMFPAIEQLMQIRATGIYNVTNDGNLTHKQILEKYREYVDPKHTYEEISVEELSQITVAGRSNCTLSNRKLKQLGILMPEIDLDSVMKEYFNRKDKFTFSTS